MKHCWIRTDKNKSECLRCGCLREKIFAEKNRSYYYYIRNNIVWGVDRPDCIDWKKENEKTID